VAQPRSQMSSLDTEQGHGFPRFDRKWCNVWLR